MDRSFELIISIVFGTLFYNHKNRLEDIILLLLYRFVKYIGISHAYNNNSAKHFMECAIITVDIIHELDYSNPFFTFELDCFCKYSF